MRNVLLHQLIATLSEIIYAALDHVSVFQVDASMEPLLYVGKFKRLCAPSSFAYDMQLLQGLQLASYWNLVTLVNGLV